MLKKDNEGFYFVSNKTNKRYELLEGVSVGTENKLSSEICFVLDTGLTEGEYKRWLEDEIESKEPDIVGFFYGIRSMIESNDMEELGDTISELVENWESE